MYDVQKPHEVKMGNKSVGFDKQVQNGQFLFGTFGKSIIKSMPIAIVIFDSDLMIIESSTKAAEIMEIGNYIDESMAAGTNSKDKVRIDWKEQLKSSLTTGKQLKFDGISYKSKKGTKILRITCTPIGSTHSTSSGQAGSLQDIEPQTQKTLAGAILIEDMTEKTNIQMRLAADEKLAAIGKQVTKIAHELNSPLDGILRYINLATRIVDQENLTKPKEYLDRCRQAILRMVQILSELLEFSRSAQTSLEYADIEQIIEEALKALDNKAVDLNIHVFQNYARDILKVRNGNLFQVFFNIIKNAFEAMPQGGELHIKTSLEPDNAFSVEFRDTGKGFAIENKDAMFEPFFTTKEKGTGLGLAICKEIIEKNHGRITVENAPQGGSIFTVYLLIEEQ
jgi:K+-sensing histidine kinase KdpD